MSRKTRSTARIRRHRRVRKRVFGTPDQPRLNVYRSLSQIYAQIIDDEEGNTLVSASSIEPDIRPDLKKKTKSEQARLVGLALAEKAREQGITRVVFDRGGFRFIGRVKALADGAREGGLKF